MSDDSIDTRSLRKEALTMLKSGEAIDKTLKWTMRTKLKTGPCAKISLNIDPPQQSEIINYNLESSVVSPNGPRSNSPVQTPNLKRSTFTSSGVTRQQIAPDTPTTIVNLKGSSVPVDYIKDAIVDVVRKERAAQRSILMKKDKPKRPSLDSMTDDSSFDSRMQINDSLSTAASITGNAIQYNHTTSTGNSNHNLSSTSFMAPTQSKQIANIANQRLEPSHRWKKMKEMRDEREASLDRRKQRETMINNFKRIVITTDQHEFHTAYRNTYIQHDYNKQKQYYERKEERKKLKENFHNRIQTKQKQQQEEGKFMKKLLKESIHKTHIQHWEEINSSVCRTQSQMDLSTSSKVNIPEQLKNKMKTAKSQQAFDSAKKDISDYYQASLSERIAQYTRTRDCAVQKAGATDTRITLSPIRGSDLFFDDSVYTIATHRSATTATGGGSPLSIRHPSTTASLNLDEYFQSMQLTSETAINQSSLSHLTQNPNEFIGIKPMTPLAPRPSTADFALKEYFASRSIQQQLFDMENFSLHSKDESSTIN